MTDRRVGTRARPDWFDLFRCFKIATDPTKIWLGFLAASFTILMLILGLYTVLLTRHLGGGQISRTAVEQVRSGRLAPAIRTVMGGVESSWVDLGRDLEDIGDSLFSSELMPALKRANTLHKLFLCGLVLLLLVWVPWAYFGGGIGRSAAVEYTTGERLCTAEIRDFAAAHFCSYLWPSVSLLFIIAGLLGALIVVGLAAAHWVAALAVGVGLFGSLYGLVAVKQKTGSGVAGLLVGLVGAAVSVFVASELWHLPGRAGLVAAWIGKVMLIPAFPFLVAMAVPVVFLGLLLLFGRGLMNSTISFEATNAFDAVTRAGDYLAKRPWHLAFYGVVGALYAAPCVLMVVVFAGAGFVIASLAIWLGFGEAFGSMYDSVLAPEKWEDFREALPGFLFFVFFLLLCGGVIGWCASLLQTFRSICYALVRKAVDGVDVSEVYVNPGILSPEPPEEPRPQNGAGSQSEQ